MEQLETPGNVNSNALPLQCPGWAGEVPLTGEGSVVEKKECAEAKNIGCQNDIERNSFLSFVFYLP